ncbi:TetR family transcriptional regulator [Aeromicrobium sp. S22]|uniref:TetR/AcrR family transcriptional regulator n=1 Tax=Aeromicrobium sp. S22 TaxID=2662029 RepID=UPI00129E99FE|nr:TetR/AcrR family transcriptional regulator [Aeromicrobium sp. S22]MRK02601.1 TetR family transcriptional regulator [Aeromicrobium sp. S22]
MSSPTLPPTGRRRSGTRKGDTRELTILDTAERLIDERGFEAVTVEAIATGAGISRGSLYFYFGSKQEVLVALIARTLAAIPASPSHATDNPDVSVSTVVRAALLDTETSWREHGRIMQAAVEIGCTVPEAQQLWRETLESIAPHFSRLLIRAGIPDDPGPTGASALARSLTFMTERSYYWSYACSGTEKLREVTDTLERIWLSVMPQDDPSSAPRP